MKNGICPKCDGEHVVGNIGLTGFGLGGSFYGVRVEKSGFLASSTPVPADIRVWICVNCGYTEHYCENAQAISRVVDRILQQEPAPKRSALVPPRPVRVTPVD